MIKENYIYYWGKEIHFLSPNNPIIVNVSVDILFFGICSVVKNIALIIDGVKNVSVDILFCSVVKNIKNIRIKALMLLRILHLSLRIQ